MSIEEIKCGASGSEEARPSDGLLTYKRRKRASPAPSGGKVTEKPNGSVICSSTCKQDGSARIHLHWKNVMENMLNLPCVDDGGGIRSCIQDALVSVPFECMRTSNMIDAADDTTRPEDACEGQRLDSSTGATSGVCRTESCNHVDAHTNIKKCQNVLLDILRSTKFALLCDLLCQNFHGSKFQNMFDFSLINLKMKNGVYAQSSRSFGEDIQQVWNKFQKVGQEMSLLANSLMNISSASYQKHVGEDWAHKASKQKCEETCQVGDQQKNSMDSCTLTQFPSYASERSSKPDQTDASFLYKVLTCKHCDTQADGKHSLICDGCEAMYHVSCIEPTVQGIPTRSWYCASCSASKRELPEHLSSDDQDDSLHQNCVVCDRLEISDTQRGINNSDKETMISNDSRESSVSSMESDEPPEPSRTAIMRLCKKCGTCEDEDKRFLVCGNTHCLYKFYHIRCLKSNQIASQQQKHQHCWYCPSCLCRACLSDKDDDKIVMCDNCDEAYHIYCMKPPRTSIPKGNWYCAPCNVNKAKEGMRKYEQWILQQYSDKDTIQVNRAKRSVDALLSAAEKLSSEERSSLLKKGKS